MAIAGATTKELMHRVGHASPAAALHYQHATQDRDVMVARGLAELGRVTASDHVLPRDIRGMDPSEPLLPEGQEPPLSRADALQPQAS